MQKPAFEIYEGEPFGSHSIPRARRIVNMKKSVEDHAVQDVEKMFAQLYSKYLFMEDNLRKQRDCLVENIQKLEEPLEVVEAFLREKREMSVCNDNTESDDDSEPEYDEENCSTVFYRLSESCFAQAKLPKKVKKVFLWLGASCMLEYDLEEAKKSLLDNASRAKTKLAAYEEDLEFLQKQISITEVNVIRAKSLIAA